MTDPDTWYAIIAALVLFAAAFAFAALVIDRWFSRVSAVMFAPGTRRRTRK